MKLMADLAQGIERDELILHYQTVQSLTTQQPTALEALVRWNHPELGRVMPGDFIPLAEESGLLRPLTEWVLRTGCDAIQAHFPDRNLRLHVNVGATELSEPRFYASVVDALKQSELDPGRLCLDMNEFALDDGDTTTHETMHRLGTIGVRFALDDYGTGASRFATWPTFPSTTSRSTHRCRNTSMQNSGGSWRR